MRHSTLLLCGCLAFAQDHKTWRDYGGASDASQYSALAQINRSNVSKLQVAWTYSDRRQQPVLLQPPRRRRRHVRARQEQLDRRARRRHRQGDLDSYAAGRHAGSSPTAASTTGRARTAPTAGCSSASNHFLRAIDARTGKPITIVRQPAARRSEGRPRTAIRRRITLVQSTTPGRVFEDLLILGSATNQGYGSAPGDIRAFDVRTGKLAWTFHTIPRPGEFGYDTWPKDAWKTVGGANVWGELSVDEKRGIVYAPTASAKYNFYGADRNGREPLRRLPARARRPHRQAALAFPDGPSRHLGLRRRHRAQAPDGPARRQVRSTWWRRSASRASSGCSIA